MVSVDVPNSPYALCGRKSTLKTNKGVCIPAQIEELCCSGKQNQAEKKTEKTKCGHLESVIEIQCVSCVKQLL